MKSADLFFTSDTHFGHKAMVERFGRPFPDIDTMDEELIRRWNALVPKNGHVFHLGDVSFRSRAQTIEILARLNGVIYLIEGNHDALSATAKKRFQWIKPYYEIVVEDTRQRLVMCHFPFRVWHQGHRGAWNLHGHSHGNLAPPIAGQLDVGVDAHRDLRPYTYAEVAAAMTTLPAYEATDHH